MDSILISKDVKVTNIAPGIIFLKNALDQETQIWLANYALRAGSGDFGHSFWESLPDGTKVLNSRAGRGRIFDAITSFIEPTKIATFCSDLVTFARTHDPKVPTINVTHMLLLWYANDEGMIWHSDNDKNDGDNEHPVVSLSLGNSTVFGYKLTGKAESTLLIESGDILIWGGPNRMLPHCVHSVNMNTCPSFLPIENVRINFTFRDAPNILGQEKLFKYNVETEHTALLNHLLETYAPAESKSESRGFN